MRYDLHEAVANHFSLAVNEEGTRFLMNPNQRHFSRIKASDLLLLDANDPMPADHPDAPDPTAWGLHGSIHRRCPHARCVMHVHSIHATVLACLEDSSLPPILSELAILVTARIWGSGYEWGAHAPIAEKAGLDRGVIDAIAMGVRPTLTDPLQSAVFEFALELHRDRNVSDATYATALDALGTAGVMDLVGICGYYTLISMTINTFEVPNTTDAKLPQLNKPAAELFR